MSPRFSILIAAYNAAPFLPRCLDSLLEQTEADFEALCVDDCSTDATASILADYARRDARFKSLRTPRNSGPAAARNLALEQACGEWTLMLDADDWLAPNTLSLLSDSATAHPTADALLLHLVSVSPDGTEKPLKNGADGQTWTGHDACLESIPWHIHGLCAVRTKLHRRLPYDTTARTYSDDNTARLHYLASRLVVQTAAPYYYRQHAASATHADGLARLDFLRANAALRRSLESQGASADLLRACEEHCWRNYVGQWRRLRATMKTLSPCRRRVVRRTLRRLLGQMRPRRLPRSLRLQPAFLFLRPYVAFALWQTFVAALGKTLGHAKRG